MTIETGESVTEVELELILKNEYRLNIERWEVGGGGGISNREYKSGKNM